LYYFFKNLEGLIIKFALGLLICWADSADIDSYTFSNEFNGIQGHCNMSHLFYHVI